MLTSIAELLMRDLMKMLISARDLEMPVTEFLVQSNLKILKTYRNIVSGKAVERKSIDVFLKDIKKIEKTQKNA